MKNIIIILILLTPVFSYCQSTNTLDRLLVEEQLDDEYMETEISLEADSTVYKHPNLDNMTDIEEFNYELQQIKLSNQTDRSKKSNK